MFAGRFNFSNAPIVRGKLISVNSAFIGGGLAPVWWPAAAFLF